MTIADRSPASGAQAPAAQASVPDPDALALDARALASLDHALALDAADAQPLPGLLVEAEFEASRQQQPSTPGFSRLIKWVIERAAISISLTRAECSRAGASTRAFRCWAMSSVRGAAKALDSGMVPSSGRRRALAVAAAGRAAGEQRREAKYGNRAAHLYEHAR